MRLNVRPVSYSADFADYCNRVVGCQKCWIICDLTTKGIVWPRIEVFTSGGVTDVKHYADVILKLFGFESERILRLMLEFFPSKTLVATAGSDA